MPAESSPAAIETRRRSSETRHRPRQGRNRLLLRAAAVAMITGSTVMAAPRPKHEILRREFGGATRQGLIDGPVSLVLDDATKMRGASASGGSAEAVVFSQPHDSGFGWFMKSDDTAGYGTWATQQIFANGFVPGDSISAYDTLFFHSTFDDPAIGDATVMTELWDGDPFSIMDTVCTAVGVSAYRRQFPERRRSFPTYQGKRSSGSVRSYPQRCKSIANASGPS